MACVLLAVATPAKAQTVHTTELRVYDGSHELFDRGQLGTGHGELLQKLPAPHFGWIRDIGGMRVMVHDPDASTQETFHLVLRKAADKVTPDIGPAGLIARKGPYKTPPGNGARSLGIDIVFTIPLPIPFPNPDFFYGILIEPTRKEGPDGLYLHYSGGYPTAQCGEHPRKGVAPNLAWTVGYQNDKPAWVKPCLGNGAFDVSLHMMSAVIQPYTVDPAAKCLRKKNVPDLGYAGLWPDLMDLEHYGYNARFGWRIADRNMIDAIAIKFMCGSLPIPTPFPRPESKLYANFADPLFPFMEIALLDKEGEARTPPINLGPLGRIFLGTRIYAQALIWDLKTGKMRLTNWCSTSF